MMLDDVLTTSATKVECLMDIERFLGEKPNVVAVVVGVDRLERTPDDNFFSAEFQERTGIALKAMTTTRLLVEALHERGKIDEATLHRCLEAL